MRVLFFSRAVDLGRGYRGGRDREVLVFLSKAVLVQEVHHVRWQQHHKTEGLRSVLRLITGSSSHLPLRNHSMMSRYLIYKTPKLLAAVGT